MADKICANCGASIPAGMTRCPNCGTQLTVTLGANQMQAFLQVAPDSGKGFTIALLEATVHIGSDPAQEIPLQARGIAPRMVRLSSEAGASGYRLTDLSNYPGDVKVNDQIVEETLLKNGDKIRLQDGTGVGVTLTYINPMEMAAALVPRKTYTLTDAPFTIGRSPNASLYMDALAVSWNHAQIVRQGGGWVVSDLGSANGTTLNDMPLTRPHELHDDDVIRIEQVLLTYKDGTLQQSSTLQNFDMDGMGLQMQVQTGLIRRRTINLLNDVSISLDPNEFVAIIGGSGSGKSTLLRALTGADVYIANQLFATLDPTTRRVDLPSGRQALITDTVGFIQKLPTTLIAAFQATLEEIRDADVILEVADVNHPNVLQHLETVEDTLAEIDVPPVPRILVWNKIDQWTGDKHDMPAPDNAGDYVAQVTVSATENTGLDKLLTAIETALKAVLQKTKLLIPYERGDLVSYLHEAASVEKQVHQEDGVLLTVKLPNDLYERFKEYRV